MTTEVKTLVNQHTGESFTMIETARDTNGEYELAEIRMTPKVEGHPTHYHMQFSESIEVVSGELEVTVNGNVSVLTQGDTVTIPKETFHQVLNASKEEDVVYRVKISPAHKLEQSMEIMYGLIKDRKTDENGTPNDRFHMALLLDMQDIRIVDLPLVFRLLMNRVIKKGKKKGIDEQLIQQYVSKK